MRYLPRLRPYRYYKDAFSPEQYFSKHLSKIAIPVFMYHDLEPKEFESQLSFLKNNNYQAISCEEAPWDSPDPKKVILTFDDGLRSVWTVAYPLLHKYGFKGTAFISPGIIHSGKVTPNLDSTSDDELKTSNYGNDDLFNWEEARIMHDSGVIDLQLHGFAHSRVFISERIINFVSPTYKDPISKSSAWQLTKGGKDFFTKDLQPGQPIYEYASRWDSYTRFFDNEDLRKKCIEYVKNKDNFYTNNDWYQELKEIADEFKKNAYIGRMETREGKRVNTAKLLCDAKKLLESRTGKIVKHFAIPWSRGDAYFINEAAKAASITHIYWEYLTQDDIESYSTDKTITHHPRLKYIFIKNLPGRGRQSFFKLITSEFYKQLKFKGSMNGFY